MQVEQLTLALGHTARQKASAESRIRLYEQARRPERLRQTLKLVCYLSMLLKLWRQHLSSAAAYTLA